MRRGGGSDEAVADGVGGGLGPAPDAELGEEVGDVGAGGVGADEERRGDLAVGVAGRQQTQDVQLARRQAVAHSGRRRSRWSLGGRARHGERGLLRQGLGDDLVQ